MKIKNDLEIICNIFFYICFIFIISSFFNKLNADNLVFVFKNPAFSGIGYSAHVLTVDEQDQVTDDTIIAQAKDTSKTDELVEQVQTEENDRVEQALSGLMARETEATEEEMPI